jgi:hypothetical protein
VLKFFEWLNIKDSLFPIKAEIPLKMGIKAVLTLSNFKLGCLKNDDFFWIDEEYVQARISKMKDATRGASTNYDSQSLIPTPEQIEKIYQKHNILSILLILILTDLECPSESSSECTGDLGELYQKMMLSSSSTSSIYPSHGFSRVSEFTSSQFDREGWKANGVNRIVNIKTLKEVKKRSERIFKKR